MPTKSATYRYYFLLIVMLAVLLSAFSWRLGSGDKPASAHGDNGNFSNINPNYEWGAYFTQDSNYNYDVATGLAVDAAGNLIILSVSANTSGRDFYHPGQDPTQMYISKVNESGDLDWRVTLETSEDSISYAGHITLDRFDNIYVTGYCNDVSSPYYTGEGDDIFLAKFDSNGSLNWSIRLPIPDPYFATISIASDGSAYITGNGIVRESDFPTVTPSIENMLLAKVTSQGKLEWLRSFGEFSSGDFYQSNYIYSIVRIDGNDSIYTVGEVNATWGNPIQPFTGERDVYVAKFDSDGSLIWNTFLGLNGSRRYEDLGDGNSRLKDSFLSDVRIDLHGEIYIAGESEKSWGEPYHPFIGSDDLFLAKVNGNGDILWNTFFGGESDDDTIYGITLGTNGQIYAVGHSNIGWGNPIVPYEDHKGFFVVQFDSEGNLLWNSFIQGGGVQFEMADEESFYLLSDYDYLWWGDEPVTIFGSDYDEDEDDLFVAKLNLHE